MEISKNMICIFTSHYSIGRSIFTLDEPNEKSKNNSRSIFTIAKEHNLKEIYLADNNFSGFVEATKSAKSVGIPFRFGLKLIVCSDLNQKDEASFETESKVIIWAKNTAGYYDLLKIYSKAATDGFYYIPRSDWKTLKSQLTNNLELIIPFYDSFLHNNLLRNGSCIPIIDNKVTFFIESHDLPFDKLIEDGVVKYCKSNGNPIFKTHQIYYRHNKDALSYQVFRCINNRTTLSKPNLDHFASPAFSFDSYLEKL